MPKSLHLLIQEQLKKPAMSSQPKKALHNGLNNVTSVKPSEKKKKGRQPTWEAEVFEQIKEERSIWGWVVAKHITFKDDPDWFETTKKIKVKDLTPMNFAHILSKKQRPELRLEKSNIEIVSMAWHQWYDHWLKEQVETYPN